MNFVIPPKSEVGSLDPSIANEGMKVKLSDGQIEEWSPPEIKPAFPDWTGIKHLKKYFGRKGGPVYPAWVFHPTEPDRLVQNAEEAMALGIFYREATQDEKDRFGTQATWDWEPTSKWRVKPQQARKVDPNRMETGKTFVASAHSNTLSQSAMIESVVATVTASVLAALKVATPAVPAGIDPARWAALQEFEARQKTVEAVNALSSEEDEDDDSALWVAEAERLGMKVDKRWSKERLKNEVLAKKAA